MSKRDYRSCEASTKDISQENYNKQRSIYGKKGKEIATQS
jgi:hypothetical protein